MRAHLEYCVQFWSLHLRQDIDTESIQHRATRLILGLARLNYEEHFKGTGPYTLERRRLRGDLLEMFKIMKVVDKIGAVEFFFFSAEWTVLGPGAIA